MGQRIGVQTVWMGMLALGLVGLTSACATKGYVRTRVDSSAHDLSARIDSNDQGIKANSNQVEELNGVTRDHSQKLSALDSGLKATDSKAQQAMSTGETAQNAANKAQTEVSTLDTKFQNRNHYVVLNEEQVRFKFNSAKLDESFKATLDDLARQLKENPDAILAMEGHTDNVGADDYNIQLGQKRVETVMRYLVVDQQVPFNRISEMSFGKARPISVDKGKEARAQNRSVVVRVMGPQLTPGGGAVSEVRPEAQ